MHISCKVHWKEVGEKAVLTLSIVLISKYVYDTYSAFLALVLAIMPMTIA